MDRQCGSSQQAIHFAIQAVMSGTQDIVIGGGVEVMSMVPIGAAVKDGLMQVMDSLLIQRDEGNIQGYSFHNLPVLNLLQINGIFQEKILINLP